MQTRWARVLRGLAAGLFSTLAAVTSHTLAGGTVSVVGLVIAMAFAAMVAIALTGRSLSAGRLAASVVLSQLAFHLAFSAIGTGAVVTMTGHHSMTIVADAASGQTVDVRMWAGHAITALVTWLMLRHGEAAFWRLRELVLFALSVWHVPPTELPAIRRVAVDRAERPRPWSLLRAALRYRGPPAIRFAN